MEQAKADMLARHLREALDSLPEPIFAVLDGGQFDDIADELSDIGISARSLFLSGGDEDIRRDGPWLVALADPAVRAHVEGLAVEKPCAVFWSCTGGEDVLWRHLRGINEVLIPEEQPTSHGARPDWPVTYETVIFRHWDPNVLAGILPLLDAGQFARVLGPAQAILMHATEHGGVKRALRPNDLPPPQRGVLRLEPEQMAAIRHQRVERSSRDVADYLREVLPPALLETMDDDVEPLVQRSRATGKELGIKTLAGHKRWAYLMAMTQGRAADTKEATDFIRHGGVSPDAQVKALIGHTADAMRASAGQVNRT